MHRTHKAERAIRDSQVVVGYRPYLDLISDLTDGKELVSSGMTKETERCEEAIRRAEQGTTVALVSSGDSGIYGMASLALELAHNSGSPISIEIIPGVTAAIATAARLGAPLSLDFACISLSDLLVPWAMIRQRLEAVAAADLVVALYNPRSKKRTSQLEEAATIFLSYRNGATPVGVGTAVGTEDESLVLSDLDHLMDLEINMRSVVIIGNGSSKMIDGWFVTPRGYNI
jgi:precorrin-3B C17-methyltransferase / cobalt-factor III methyltransferase